MAEISVVPIMVVDLIKKALYVSGALGLYHRLRNRDTLTVIVFHRVLDPGDARWATSDPDYTLSTTLFEACLDFFGRHYHVISAAQLLDARRSGSRLPPRSLLITFDDGWSDNVDYALEPLVRARFPALLFVIANVIGTRAPFFQEQIYGAWRSGALTTARIASAIGLDDASVDTAATHRDEARLRGLIERIERMDDGVREHVMLQLADALSDRERHWLTKDELQALERNGVDIGMHGMTHVPMTRAHDLDAELAGARVAGGRLRQGGEPPVSMSFPHGRFDDAIAQQAVDAGYELVFTSVQGLNPTRPRPGWLLARCGFEARSIADRNGRLRAERLALYAFRLPHTR